MKLNFVKTLEGHEMEFVRLMYPLRYDVILRILNANPIIISVVKDTDDTWQMEYDGNVEDWIKELEQPILSEIGENEKDV